MTTARRSGAWFLAASVFVATAATAAAQERSAAGPAPRVVVFEAFTRFT